MRKQFSNFHHQLHVVPADPMAIDKNQRLGL